MGNGEPLFAHLAEESAAIISELQDWRSAHPTATFAEMEVAVDQRLDQLRARLLGDLALARAADGGERATAERPVCPTCGTGLVRRGRQTRHLTVPGDQTVTLDRHDWGCPACGAGLSPPG